MKLTIFDVYNQKRGQNNSFIEQKMFGVERMIKKNLLVIMGISEYRFHVITFQTV